MSEAYSSDIAFSPAVKAVQARKGSRAGHARMEQAGSWETEIGADLASFIAEQTSAFLGTASADGQPYIQHRGGPPGFLHVLEPHVIGFADFSGNRQYITQGNLSENPKAFLFLIDFAARRRVKFWGQARIVEGDAALMARLAPREYRAKLEQVLLFTVAAWDVNCPQHIPQRFDAAQVAAAIAERNQRIAALQAELAALRAGSARAPD
jgi:predicted pyridoxine 5'-phosphate oxidase superfamily flavin-nucleotide-binding protein